MALRLLRAYLPSNDAETALEIRAHADVEFVDIDDRGATTLIDVVVPQEASEAIVSLLENRYGRYDEFRILILPVEGMVPRVDEPEGAETDESSDWPPINVEELYHDVYSHARLSWTYAISIAIAALVAATGIVRDSTELVVASMILAPLLGPNVAIATATALADSKMAVRALKVTAAGTAISIAVGAVMGAIFGVQLDAAAVSGRLTVGVLDFVIAGTAGVAAALSYTSGAFGRIVGVMIAIALLPPMVLTGMLLGTLDFADALGPALVTGVNLIAINFCGVAVLFLRNVRPRSIYEQEKARHAVYASIAAWGLMLAILVALVVFARSQGAM